MWLGGGVKQNPSLYGASVAVYGELINADNNPSIGKYGVDYQQEIQRSNKTNSWNRLFVQYSSPTNFRPLDTEKNHSGFFQNNQKYVLLPLNLKSMTSPERLKCSLQNCNRYICSCKTSPCGGTGIAGDAGSSHVNMAILNHKILYLCSKEQELEEKRVR